MDKLKCFHLSDTHQFHEEVIIPENVDVIIHSGDFTNSKPVTNSDLEFNKFLDWYKDLDVPYKVLCAGNHDNAMTKMNNVSKVKDCGILYEEHNYLEIEGRLFFLSPYTPIRSLWWFMVNKQRLGRYWEALIEGIDVLVTHGPPKSILDIAEKRESKQIEFCGDSALMKKILKVNPKFHCFGHIHDNHGIKNFGTRTLKDVDTVFMNSSMIEDNKFDGIRNPGHIFYI